VIVDDRIPCEKVGSGWKPIFASPKVRSVCMKVCVFARLYFCLCVCVKVILYAYQNFIFMY